MKYPVTLSQDCIFAMHFAPVYKPISSIDIGVDSKIPVEISYAYSYDNFNWGYYEYDLDAFLNSIREACFRSIQIFIKIRFQVVLEKCTTDLVIGDTSDLSNNLYTGRTPSIDFIKFDGKLVTPVNMSLFHTDEFNVQPPTIFNPYENSQGTYELWNNLAKGANDFIGHWCYYFKTVPDQDSKSWVFKSYRLHNVVDMKLIKIAIPGNSLPSNRNIYSEWGISLPDEFQINILKSAFTEAFGWRNIPNENDYLFLPLTGKMYSINSVYDDKTFMYRSIQYNAILTLFEKSEIVEDNSALYDLTDFTQLELNQEALQETESNVASPEVLKVYQTNAYRVGMQKNCKPVRFPLEIDGIEIFENMLLMSNIDKSEESITFNIAKSDISNWSLNFVLYLEKNNIKSKTRRILEIPDFISVELRNSLNINYNQTKLSSPELNQGVHYFISIGFSNQFCILALTIYSYTKETGFAKVCDIYEQVQREAKKLSLLKFFGGKYLVSNISVDNCFIEPDNFLNWLTRTLPENETNVMFDKAQVTLEPPQFTV